MGADRSGHCGVWIRDWTVLDCPRQLTALQGHAVRSVGISVVMGSFTIVAGVVLVVAGLVRYRKTRAQLIAGTFEPAGFVLDLITVVTVVFGFVLAGYLIYTEKVLG